ncbi:MAG TPA: phage tail protein [Sphingomicrobium sp.]|nr:phage tail protein [Sphingomicrobium sp.]
MATLVFTAVGNALGGPVGGAIGSLLGQAIDQQMLGSSRKGPRLGDLSVQTSNYGTHIPRVYGTMRVAGSVVWSTELRESSAQAGAKGQTDTLVYSYSASFAVALSSRPVGRIRRIWADGKLLRGEAGDFKVSTGFRFHPGNEDQAVDPLIASVEGIAETPAYRGIALAVFEDLQLAEYGNRIPFLTFEVEAEPGAVGIADVLSDASGGTIACQSTGAVLGYAAHGPSVAAAVEPLVERFGVELFDDGTKLRSPLPASLLQPGADELGAATDAGVAARVERTQAPARSLPAVLTLTYHDPARDYQIGQMRASNGDDRGAVQASELPAVLAAGAAKALAEGELARRWAARDRLTLRLMPRALPVQPGAVVRFEGQLWIVQRTFVDRMVVQLELRPQWAAPASLAADAGRAAAAADELPGNVGLVLFDLPHDEGDQQSGATLHLAAASDASGWRPIAVDARIAGTTRSLRTAPRQSVLGTAISVLAPGTAELIDTVSSVEIALVDPDQWLESCDDAALAAGSNMAVIGSEIIQFGSAVPSGAKRFVLSRLVRGRRGSEWAMGGHAAGEKFALLLPGTLQPIRLPQAMRGALIEVRAAGAGGAPDDARLAAAEAVRPLSPVHLAAASDGAGGIVVRWVRRSRTGWGWVDEVDVPLGEAREMYRVTIEGSAGRIETETQASVLTLGPGEVTSIGPGGATVSVRQIGDFAASRPALLSINL